MVHGVTGYFLERARFERRLSMLMVAVSMVSLGLLGLAHTPIAQNILTRTVRFGYEGPEQYVRRITIRQYQGSRPVLSDLGQVSPRMERRGGAQDAMHRAHSGQPTPLARVIGPGSSDRDLVVRSVGRSANVPVVRSEDLVIDRLVRPLYPTTLLEQNIEGKVMVQALVDTVGKVIDVQIMASTGERLFERAAEDAVWQCRFRPFRPAGESPTEVYAVFRFVFSIY
jgi:TonB family protein